MIQKVLFLVLCKFATVSFVRSQVEERNVVHYTNVWGVKLSKNYEDVLQKLRIHEGFEIIEQKHHIPDFHILIHRRHPKKGKYKNKNLTDILLKYKGILWAEQIFLRRVYTKSVSCPGKSVSCPGKSVSGPSNYNKLLNDNRFLNQWYLQDCRKIRSLTQYDLGVVPVWYRYRLFGSNIKVMVVDTGLQTNHPDLKYNYDPEYGYDVLKDIYSPKPRGNIFMPNYSHGTNMAGIIGMQANNKICGVGIAPLVTLGAIRLTGSRISIDKISRAITFRARDLDVSNNSWSFGRDGGKYLLNLDSMTMNAFKAGIVEGRRSKGLIFIFPSGNGKEDGETCAHSAVVGMIYTITVAGVNHDGSISGYSQRCSNILVTAYSGDDGIGLSGNIVTTTTCSMCASWVIGTSAATAIISGIVALILEANIGITWREVHHVLVWTSEVAALAHNKTWSRNEAGFYFSPDFGLGLVDAFEAVTFAMFMKPIPPMNSCVLVPKITGNAVFNRKKIALNMSISTNGCKNLPSEVNYMEHVQLMVSVEHPQRGAIRILMISPSGTKTILMESRRLDRSKSGLRKWVMDTVHLWGESPPGKWSIIFYDTTSPSDYQGRVYEVALIIHGTKYKPPHYTRARTYRKFIYQDGNMWS